MHQLNTCYIRTVYRLAPEGNIPSSITVRTTPISAQTRKEPFSRSQLITVTTSFRSISRLDINHVYSLCFSLVCSWVFYRSIFNFSMTASTKRNKIIKFICLHQILKTKKRFPMMDIKLPIKLFFRYTTHLAFIVIPFSSQSSLFFPTCPPMTYLRCSSTPKWMFLFSMYSYMRIGNFSAMLFGQRVPFFFSLHFLQHLSGVQ